MLELGLRSSASFPLRVFGSIRGALNFYAAEPNFFDEGELKLLDELAMDVSFAMEFAEKEAGRARAEAAQRDSEIRYRRLFETAKDGILILDAETGMVVDVNPFF